MALDVTTGAIKWKTYTIPDLTDYAGNAVWGSTPVVDIKRNSLYVTTGNTYKVPAGVVACVSPLLPETPENAGALRAYDLNCDENFFDAVLALSLDTGEIKWAHRTHAFDSWTVGCISSGANCDGGPDYDFGQGPSLFSVSTPAPANRGPDEVLGVGQKNGLYWGLNPDSGEVVYATRVGPGGTGGGALWGSAVDGERAYVATANFDGRPWTLSGGDEVDFGVWTALDGAIGEIIWQTPDPNGFLSMPLGAITIVNGVMYAGTLGPIPTGAAAGLPTMLALDAESGAILNDFLGAIPGGSGSVVGAPAVVGGKVYWGSGYSFFGTGGTSNGVIYAFELQ